MTSIADRHAHTQLRLKARRQDKKLPSSTDDGPSHWWLAAAPRLWRENMGDDGSLGGRSVREGLGTAGPLE